MNNSSDNEKEENKETEKLSPAADAEEFLEQILEVTTYFCSEFEDLCEEDTSYFFIGEKLTFSDVVNFLQN